MGRGLQAQWWCGESVLWVGDERNSLGELNHGSGTRRRGTDNGGSNRKSPKLSEGSVSNESPV
jgi:hypothetical protein